MLHELRLYESRRNYCQKQINKTIVNEVLFHGDFNTDDTTMSYINFILLFFSIQKVLKLMMDRFGYILTL